MGFSVNERGAWQDEPDVSRPPHVNRIRNTGASWRRAAGVALLVVAPSLSSCTTSPAITADNPIFTGIDPATVQEVLASEAVKSRLVGDSDEQRQMRLQGTAANFVLCRQAYDAYRSWLTTGTPPRLPAPINFEHPIQPAVQQYVLDRKEFTAHLESGEISALRSHLVNETGCGAWIPVNPGEQTGPTIADAVRGG